MKRNFILAFAILFTFTAIASTIPSVAPSDNNSIPAFLITNNHPPRISSLKIKQVEKILGRKLKLKEKIAFKFFQWKLRRGFVYQKAGDESKKGKTAMILGIIGIATLFIPYVSVAAIPCAILAIVFGNQARKENPEDGKAKTGVILGWITVGLVILALVLVVALLSTGGWWW